MNRSNSTSPVRASASSGALALPLSVERHQTLDLRCLEAKLPLAGKQL